MAGYFNKTRGPITVSLKTGESAMVPPKGTLDVTIEQDGSASLHAMVRRGLLVRLKTPPQTVVPSVVVPSVPPTPPTPSASSKPSTLVTPSTSAPVVPVTLPELPSKQWSKSRLIEHAEAMGLEIETDSTKVEILRVIEEAGR